MESALITLRQASIEDAEALSKLCSETFLETYVPSRPQLKSEFLTYTEKNYSKEAILTKFLDLNLIYLIAEIDNTAVGYCRIYRKTSPEGDNEKSIKLSEIYVKKEMIGKGVGKKLMEEFLNIAKEQGAQVAWLGVWEGNQKAIDFYKKWGFEVFGSEKFTIEATTDIDLLMKKNI